MLTYIKYVLLLLAVIIASVGSDQILVIPASLIEILFIFYISNNLLKKYNKIGYCVNFILSFIFLLQQGVLFFSGEYISEIMVDNLNMVGNLGSLLSVYIMSAIGVLIIAFLPCRYIYLPFLKKKVMIIVVAFYICLLFFMYRSTYQLCSPYLMFCKTSKNIVLANISRYRYRISDEDKRRFFVEFHQDSIKRSDVIQQRHIPRYPNVIVLFVEGLSMGVLDVGNDMNINLTPNLDELYKKSIVFENYYNQSAATFAGLKGQLYSGFFYPNGTDVTRLEERNSPFKLISLIDILKKNNYTTSFVNVEPQVEFIVDYFKSFSFDNIYSNNITDRRLSDKEAFGLLETVIKNSEKPYFIGMYNIGTHHGFDSPDLKYGDGKSEIFNRFYNYDAQFGVFFNNLLKNNLLDNTILIVTTDHASYHSIEFRKTFKNTSSYFIDKIPLFVYWNGVNHEVINVDGRNSVDLAPTILDMIDVNGENYFLGTSLFLKEKNLYNTTSTIGQFFYYTGNNKVEPLFDGNTENIWAIKKFYSISDNE